MGKSPSWILLSLALASGLQAAEAPAWQYAAFPGYEIYSDLPGATAAPLVRDLFLLQGDFQRVWPTTQEGSAALLVLCARPGEYYELNQIAAARIEQGRGPASLMRTDLGASGPKAVVNVGLLEELARQRDPIVSSRLRELYGAYVVRQLGERVPPWLGLGVSRLVGRMVCQEGSIGFPALTTDPTLADRKNGSEQGLQAALRKGSFLTLDQIFSEASAPRARGPVSPASGQRGDECYELTQFLLFGDHGRHRADFIRFARAAANGPLDEANFQGFFGMNYHDLLLALWRDADLGKDQRFDLKSILAGSAPPLPAFRRATETEVERMKAAWRDFPGGDRAPGPP